MVHNSESFYVRDVSEMISIGKQKIGADAPVFIIAEAGVNHNGDLSLAKKLVDRAANAGANAVKFQVFRAERLAGEMAPKANYQKHSTPSDVSQLDMLKDLELEDEEFIELRDYCRALNILFLATPFDPESVDFLDTLDVPVFNIGSWDVTNLPLIEHIAQKDKPILLSTGMSYLSQVDETVRARPDQFTG